ncbi:unnamed protein product [Adineta steineri]|uniref:RING-type domain-containing protein n=1 Tax=Adineta steineri TaxID=433720 RepID=A0A819YC90_9BILA|nr:unnamed protein product [Adineta steineri]CAF4154522.1 unnamed protein product [Adineta steineri]
MRAHDQAQPPPPPPPPPTPPPSPHPHLQTTCLICLNNIQPNETVIHCTMCRKAYHYGELITWLTTRRYHSQAVDCPACRGDMQCVLDNQQLPQNPNNNTPPGLQPAELLGNINNWNWSELLQ